jgi:hypothetical protein
VWSHGTFHILRCATVQGTKRYDSFKFPPWPVFVALLDKGGSSHVPHVAFQLRPTISLQSKTCDG